MSAVQSLMASVGCLTERMSDIETTPRRAAGRVGAWIGVAFLALLGIPILLLGLLGLTQDGAPGLARLLLCFGLVLLIVAAGAGARTLADSSPVRPAPRLVQRDGEAALELPRWSRPSRISCLVLIGLAGVCALAALFAALSGAWGWVVVCVVPALGLAWTGRSADSGGLWFTPTRVVAQHDGVRWALPWDAVAGAVPGDPTVVTVRAGQAPAVSRSARRYRSRTRDGEALGVSTRHLAGGESLAAYVIGKALLDPAFRAALGSPESLPPSP